MAGEGTTQRSLIHSSTSLGGGSCPTEEQRTTLVCDPGTYTTDRGTSKDNQGKRKDEGQTPERGINKEKNARGKLRKGRKVQEREADGLSLLIERVAEPSKRRTQ